MLEHDHTRVYVGTHAFHPALARWPCPTPGLPWLACRPCVNRERKGPRACLLSACHLCLPLVFMATSPMVTSVEGITGPLPGYPYSVSASCYSWHCDPAVDWCKGGVGVFSPAQGRSIQPVCVLTSMFLC